MYRVMFSKISDSFGFVVPKIEGFRMEIEIYENRHLEKSTVQIYLVSTNFAADFKKIVCYRGICPYLLQDFCFFMAGAFLLLHIISTSFRKFDSVLAQTIHSKKKHILKNWIYQFTSNYAFIWML
jgi:hypothetical protein